jgi:hypothetical protein
MNQVDHSCGLKSAASSKLRVSTLRAESKELMTISQRKPPAAAAGLVTGS